MKFLKLFSIFKTKSDSFYRVGKYKMRTPHNYALANIQKKHRLYDKFLIFLTRNLNSDGDIIDIGANIGDTTLALIQNTEKHIYSIEASDFFYNYLKINTENIDSSDRISLLQFFVGSGKYGGELKHSIDGTAQIELKKTSNVNFLTLDSLIIKNKISKISMIKIDTDGFDFDIINSGMNFISEHKPILFLENFIDHEFQVTGYNKMYEKLKNIGYCNICVFDNYGNILTETNDFNLLKNLNDYFLSHSLYNISKTISYVDVLLCCEKDKSIFDKSLIDFKKEIII